jgi:hypothetical protein
MGCPKNCLAVTIIELKTNKPADTLLKIANDQLAGKFMDQQNFIYSQSRNILWDVKIKSWGLFSGLGSVKNPQKMS